MTETELVKTAEKEKVKVYPTSIYYEMYDSNRPAMVLLTISGPPLNER